MQVSLTRSEQGLRLDIPAVVAEQFQLAEGTVVDIAVDGDRIVVRRPQRYRIDQLVADLNHDDLADAFDWGPDQGRETLV